MPITDTEKSGLVSAVKALSDAINALVPDTVVTPQPQPLQGRRQRRIGRSRSPAQRCGMGRHDADGAVQMVKQYVGPGKPGIGYAGFSLEP